MGNYQPIGLMFHDRATGKEMFLVSDDDPRESVRGWILYRHADGQWVTLRKATADDIAKINVTAHMRAQAIANAALLDLVRRMLPSVRSSHKDADRWNWNTTKNSLQDLITEAEAVLNNETNDES